MSNGFLDNLRSKSDATKNRLAFVFAAIVTIIIFCTWIFVFNNKKEEPLAKKDSTLDDFKPLFMIFKTAKSGVDDIKETNKNYKANVIEPLSTETDTIEE